MTEPDASTSQDRASRAGVPAPGADEAATTAVAAVSPAAGSEHDTAASPAAGSEHDPAPDPESVVSAPVTHHDPGTPLPRTYAQLCRLLGLEPDAGAHDRVLRRNGWLATALVTALAALTRLVGLGSPSEIMFDETYYVKDAYALWHNGYESTWKDGADALFAQGDTSALTSQPSFIVHPQLGKWLIALGAQLGGWDSAFGWRLSVAVAGIITVFLLARLTMRLTASPVLTMCAGLLCVLDGVALTESRIALLDGFIATFALLTVTCMVRDRQWMRERLARRLTGTPAGTPAPLLVWRPWLLATAVCAGLTCSIKWSGAYLLAVVGVSVLTWDVLALRAVQARRWQWAGLLRHGVSDFVTLVPVAFAVYVANWWSWFAHPAAYKHGWAAAQRQAGAPVRTWLPDSLNDLVEYHLAMYRFHIGLHSEHPYMSTPESWLLQLRPTSVFWKGTGELTPAACGADQCVRAITTIGTIPLWWAGVVALVAVAVIGTRQRDWRVWVALSGYAGLYLPWFAYRDRTIFTFYSVAFEPYVVLVVVLALGYATGLIQAVPGSPAAQRYEDACEQGECGPGWPAPRGALAWALGFGTLPTRRGLPQAWAGVPVWRQRGEGWVLTALLIAACVLFAALWMPLWTGQPVSYEFWHMHMLLDSWI